MYKYLPFAFLLVVALYSCKKTPSENIGKSVLFTIDNRPVLAEEFIYLYEKNNFNNENIYSQDDIRAYFDLFPNFKLKVRQAYEEGIDTSASFTKEFNAYKAELIKPYLLKTQETGSLIKEVYERLQVYIHASHILVRINDIDDPEDTLRAYNKIVEIREKALAGDDFSDLAKAYSEDPSAKANGGDLGFFTAMRMVLPFENAAYKTAPGSISDIVKTQFGYHILNVHEKIPNKGKVQIAHIMAGRTHENPEAARNKIFEIHEQAVTGGDWNYLVSQFSDDDRTHENGGDIGFFGQGQLPPEFRDFEQVAFELDSVGQISEPVESPYGWHILKLLDRRLPESFEEMQTELERQVIRSELAELKKEQIISRLKNESHFRENENIRKVVYSYADSSLLSGQWKNNFPDSIHSEALFQLKNESIRVKEFADYIVKNQRRIRNVSPTRQMEQLYESLVESKLMEFEEQQIAFKNVEYRMLENEYREGLLLFDVMDKYVWSKSLTDTANLALFYKQNIENYKWKERADAVIIKVTDLSYLPEIKKYLEGENKPSRAALEETFNTNSSLTIQVEEGLFEKDEHYIFDRVGWSEGIFELKDEGRAIVVKINAILPSGYKSLEQCRGKVISDYQVKLEADWIADLKSKYPVHINEESLNKIYTHFEKK